MNIGDVVWVEFRSGAGRAQSGHRPAIVIQAAAATKQLPTVLLIPLTTQTDALRFPGTVLVEPDPKNGLRSPSVALVFQLSVMDRRFVARQLGTVSMQVIGTIWAALDDLTGRSTESS